MLRRQYIWPRGQAVKTSPFHGGNTGSIPVGVSCSEVNMPMWLNLLRLTTSIAGRALITNQLLGSKYADVAQLAEQLMCNQQVIGSSPIIGFMGEFPSGQRGQTVNLLAVLSMVRIHLPPLNNFISVSSRGGAVRKLVGLITRRS